MSASTISFSAGPAMLPREVIAALSEALIYWPEAGRSLVGISHRHPQFILVMDEIEALIRDLLNVPEGYEVIWAPGGASAQFSLMPLNLLASDEIGAYQLTGYWGELAYREAAKLRTVEAWNPERQDHYRYLHTVLNETIAGKLISLPENHLPVIADATSYLMSLPVAVERFGAVYASCQKNMGIPGLALVIIRRDLLQDRNLPALFFYSRLASEKSLVNTPPVVTLLSILYMLRWILS